MNRTVKILSFMEHYSGSRQGEAGNIKEALLNKNVQIAKSGVGENR